MGESMQNDAGQPSNITPEQFKAEKKRHGCLTAWLIFIIIGVILVIIYNFIYFADYETWEFAVIIAIGILQIICVIAIFKWKKWGFWGICTLAVITVIINLLSGVGPYSFAGLFGIALLYGVLQIGGENKGWKQLE
jgi:hypothetical protein